jgi:hypothetical protein
VGPRACGCLHLLQPSTLTLTMTASPAGGLTPSTPQPSFFGLPQVRRIYAL